MNNVVEESLDLLGRRMRDKITGVHGVITSICFDLYGCVQAVINRGLDKDGKAYEQNFYDTNRLELCDDRGNAISIRLGKVMEAPRFTSMPPEKPVEKRRAVGPAEKPKISV